MSISSVVHVIATGGTIDKVYDPIGACLVVGDPAAADFFQDFFPAGGFVVDSILRKDSLDLTSEDRRLICRYVRSSRHRHILLTHGTDTLIETAIDLEGLELSDKVVCVTGALIPAAFSRSDAGFNLGAALMAVGILQPGVYVAMNGQAFAPSVVEKDKLTGCFRAKPLAGRGPGHE